MCGLPEKSSPSSSLSVWYSSSKSSGFSSLKGVRGMLNLSKVLCDSLNSHASILVFFVSLLLMSILKLTKIDMRCLLNVVTNKDQCRC